MMKNSVSFEKKNTEDGKKLDVVGLYYSIYISGSKKCLLRDVTFSVESGEACAIMGASGAGKSTLLDLVADRKLEGEYSGQILVNGRKRSPWFNRDSAYVLQDSYFHPTLTVEETLRFSAWTRMDEGSTFEQRQSRVEEVLGILELQHVRDSLIGGEIVKGISGGQAKRLSIGVELIAYPSILFLDEPTSGLDSSLAYEVMFLARKLANANRTLLFTIHQPSPEIYALFDKLVLLAHGRMVYCGPADQAVAYFMRPEFGLSFSKEQNPADYIIDVSTGIGLVKTPQALESIYKSSEYSKRATAMVTSNSSGHEDEDDKFEQGKIVRSRYATGWYTQLLMLLSLRATLQRRQFVQRTAFFFVAVFFSLLTATLFYKKGDLSRPLGYNGLPNGDASDITKLVLLFCIEGVTVNILEATPIALSDPQRRRDMASYAYSAFPAWMVEVVEHITSTLTLKLPSIIITQVIVDMSHTWENFFFIMGAYFLGDAIGTLMFKCIGAAARDPVRANLIVPFVSLLHIQFCTVGTINLKDVPPYYFWAPPLVFTHWLGRALIVNEFEQYFDGDDGTVHATDGFDIIGYYDFQHSSKHFCAFVLLLFFAFFGGLLYFFMRPDVSKLEYVDDLSLHFVDEESEQDSVNFSNDKDPLKASLITGAMSLDSEGMPRSRIMTVDDFKRSVADDNLWSTGCRLVFRDLTYSVIIGKDERMTPILTNAYGVASAGEMCALMGASGAGKTTLLDILACRKTIGTIGGEIYYNGQKLLSKESLTNASAYVMQEDVHFPDLTVRETLYFAAALRLDDSKTSAEREARVDKMLRMFGLQDYAKSMVGGEEKRGISGGQKKRLSIAVETIHLPGLIFLDEPTTGLDSAVSNEVMNAVRNMANQNRTIISTIHQPSEAIFRLFDTVLLLAGGEVVYFGQTSGVVNFFIMSPFRFRIEENKNSADFIIAIAGCFIPDESGNKVERESLVKYYADSELYRNVKGYIDSVIEEDSAQTGMDVENKLNLFGYYTSTSNQTISLVHRRIVRDIHEPFRIYFYTIRALFFAILVGSLYYYVASGTEDTTSNGERQAVVFFLLQFYFIGNLDQISSFFKDRPIMYRERNNRMYGPFPYCVSIVSTRLPMTALVCYISCAIIYNMVGLNHTNPAAFGTLYGVVLLFGIAGTCFCLMAAAITGNQMGAQSFAGLFVRLNQLFAGFYVSRPDMPKWLRTWAPYCVPFKYADQVLIINEFRRNDDIPRGIQVIENQGLTDMSEDSCINYIFVFVAAFVLAFYLGVRFVNLERR